MAAKRFYHELEHDLARLADENRRRAVRPVPRSARAVELDGQTLINLAGNDYLGLSAHPRVKAAARAAIDADGTGAGASKLIVGHLDAHERLERRFAAFKHAEAAALLPTGYMANLAAITALAGPGDQICLDKLNHASLIDAGRLSGAELRTFPHHGYDKLERLLERGPRDSGAQPSPTRPPRQLIVTDSVFSMDGDVADLPRLCEIAERFEAVLIVDEAHATGLLGETGAGLCQRQGVSDRVDVVISTASKGLGGLGGIVTAAEPVIETLHNRARSMIYTTGAPPAQAAQIEAALDVVRDEPWRRERVADLSRRLRAALSEQGWRLAGGEAPDDAHGGQACEVGEAHGAIATPIVPLVVGSNERALSLASHLRARGILAAPIRYPTVPPGAARVRLSLRADLTDEDMDELFRGLLNWSG